MSTQPPHWFDQDLDAGRRNLVYPENWRELIFENFDHEWKDTTGIPHGSCEKLADEGRLERRECGRKILFQRTL